MLEPLASQSNEVLGILVDALWPDMVQAMEPLVRRLVHVSRPLGSALYHKPEPVRCACKKGEEDGEREREMERERERERDTNNMSPW